MLFHKISGDACDSGNLFTSSSSAFFSLSSSHYLQSYARSISVELQAIIPSHFLALPLFLSVSGIHFDPTKAKKVVQCKGFHRMRWKGVFEALSIPRGHFFPSEEMFRKARLESVSHGKDTFFTLHQRKKSQQDNYTVPADFIATFLRQLTNDTQGLKGGKRTSLEREMTKFRITIERYEWHYR